MAITTTKKEMDTPTAAAVQALLEAPDRERRAAEEAAEASARMVVQTKLAEGLQARLAVLAAIGAEAALWFTGRPTVTTAVFQETLGDHARELIDRVVALGSELLESAGPAAQAAARQWLEPLTEPMPREAFEAALGCLKAMEEKEPILHRRATAWRALRATTAAQLRRAIELTATQCAWLEGGPR